MIISIKIPYLEKKEKIMLKTFLSLKNIQVSGANSNTIEMVKMQIIDQFENGEKKNLMHLPILKQKLQKCTLNKGIDSVIEALFQSLPTI